MSNKIFGITVKDNIPYVRTIFFSDNEIEKSLLHENKSIIGINTSINIDDNSNDDSEFDGKLTISKNDFDSETYNGEFHLFVNEAYTNSYYTTGNISYNKNAITSEIPFLQSTNTEEIKNYIKDLQKITYKTEEIDKLEDKSENLEAKIEEIKEEIGPIPDAIIPEILENSQPLSEKEIEKDILDQIKELNTNISKIDASIQNFNEKLKEKTIIENKINEKLEEKTIIESEKATIKTEIEEKEEATKDMINKVLEKPKLEGLKNEIDSLLDSKIQSKIQLESEEDKELQRKIMNTKEEIKSLEQILESTTDLVHNKIKQTTDENKRNNILAQEKVKMDIEIKEMEKQIQNLKAKEENTKSISIQEQIDNLKSDLTPKMIIDTKEINPINTISVVTNTQSKLTDTLTKKISEIISKFEALKGQLNEHNNKTTGGDENEQDRAMKKCIELYIGIVQYIIYRPIFYKLTSLKCYDYKELLLNYEIPLYDGKTTGVNKNRVNKDFLKTMYENLLSFMFVNMSSFKDSILTDKLFYENNKGMNYKEVLNKYKLYTDNFNELLNITQEEANSNPLLLVYISEFINLLTNLLKNDNVNKTDNNYKYNLYETLLNYITSQYDLLNTIVNTYFPLLELPDNEELRNKIDQYIEKINNNNIITYLKLRNDEDNNEKYNNRFKINMNDNGIPNKIMIDYMDDNIPFYVFNKEHDEFILSPEIKELSRTSQNYNLNNDLNTISIQKYKYGYLFGPFSHIFKPGVKNEEIAQKMTVVKDKIKENKPIFIIGYGASGAGKTSSLIYFKKNQENGILINLCNQLGDEGIFGEIELKCKEFYHTTGIGSLDNPEIVNVPNEELGIGFVFKNGNFVLTEEYKHSTHHQYRMINKERNDIEKETVFKAGTKLGEVIIHLIDTDRFVKATTNNPNSSRSHTLVFVKLKGQEIIDGIQKEKIGNIIIGDFAGVENKFACENPNTINAFLSIKRDNIKDAQGNEIYVPYYSTEAYKGNPDPLGVIESGELNGGSISQQCIPKIEVKDPIYDFENPVIRENWKFDENLINDLNDKIIDRQKLKLYMDVVRNSGNIEKNVSKNNLNNFKEIFDFINDYTKFIKTFLEKKNYIIDETKILEDNINYLKSVLNTFIETFVTNNKKEQEQRARILLENLNKNNFQGNLEQFLLDTINTKMNSINLEINKFKDFDNSRIRDNVIKYNGINETTISRLKNIASKSFVGIIENVRFDKFLNTVTKTGNSGNPQIYIEDENINNLKDYVNELKIKIIDKIKSAINNIKEYENRQIEFQGLLEKFNKNSNYKKDIQINILKNNYGSIEKTQLKYTELSKWIIEYFSPIMKALDIIIDYTPLKNSNGEPFESSTKLPDTISNLRGYKTLDSIFRERLQEKLNEKGITYDIIDDMIYKLFDNSVALYDKIKDLELETSCRQENSNVICENRREEGYFINNSLEKVREVIKKILFEKNKNSINITPNFIDVCFKNYCPQHSNCFSFDVSNDKSMEQDKTGSVIFDEIYNELKEIKGYETPQKMYEDIIISIFCVFNISRGANNPPPTPYLDINKLKLLFYYEDLINKTSIQEEFIKQATRIIDMITNGFKDKVGDLVTIKSNISKQKSIFYLFNQVKSYFEENKNIIDKNTYNRLHKFFIKEFIDMIDKSNSVSAIGTLEFLDQIAKFNTIKTICNSQNIQTNLIDRFNRNNVMKQLYQEFDGGMKKKYTKKHRLHKEKKNTKRYVKKK